MDWLTAATHAVTFSAGVLTKVAADWWTDSRRGRQQRSTAQQRFGRIEAAMPALLNEMRADFSGASLVREFVVLPRKGNSFNHGETKRFEYFAEDHEDLAGKIAMLENDGYIRDVRVHRNSPIYRMTEEFVQLLER